MNSPPLPLTIAACLQHVEATYVRMTQAVDRAQLASACYFDEVHAAYTARLAAITQSTQAELGGVLRWMTAPWTDSRWDSFAPELDAPITSTVRIGHFAPLNTPLSSDLPALVPLVGHGHLFFQGAHVTEVHHLLQLTLLRLLVAFPPGMLRLTLVDSVTTGSTLAAFLHLPPMLRGSEVIVRADALEQQLRELEDLIAHLSQTRLSNLYPTIEAYNASPDALTIPYRVVAFVDLPAGLDERAAGRLLAIARNGPRVGVYIVANLNPTIPSPRNFSLDTLTALGTVVRLTKPDRLMWNDPLLANRVIATDTLPPVEQMNRLLGLVGQAAVAAAESLPFRRFAIPLAERWQGDSSDRLCVPIGVNGTGRPYLLDLGGDGVVHHGLIGGTVGSGKSNLLHVLILQLTLRYAPEELALYLLDFREGVGFQPYTALPHARVVALESEREFALSVLQHLQQEVQTRGQIYKQAPGGAVEKLPEYRRQTGQRLPRILLIMDEFQVLFSEDDRVGTEAARILEDLVKRGRGFGIHVLLCSQSPNITNINGNRIYDQMGLRIALRCSPQVSLAILGNDAASRLERSGEALANNEASIIRVANLPVEERRGYVATVTQRPAEFTYPPAVTFESQTPANLTRHSALQALLSQATWPPYGPTAQIWLGEPIVIKGPTAALIERYAGANLLMVGGSDAEGYGLLVAALISLAAQRSPTDARFVLIDLARPDMPGAEALRCVAETLPHTTELLGERQSADTLNQLLTELVQRQEGTSTGKPDIYLVIAGIQRWRALRSGDSYRPAEASKQISRLAEEGPEVGIHLLLWVDSIANLERAVGRSALAPFDRRVALRMAESESNTLVGSHVAARMTDNRALLRDESEAVGVIEKFKPYPLPELAVIEAILVPLRSRA